MGPQAAKPVARSKEPRREHTAQTRTALRQRLLGEILDLWNGTFEPEPQFELPAFSDIEDFYRDYRWALGDELYASSRGHELSDATREKERRTRESFVAGYFALRRGDRSGAMEQFRELVEEQPDFVDAWVWLAGVAPDEEEQIHHLEEALVRDPAHPLARDAMAVLQGRVAPEQLKTATGTQATAVRCPKCAGSLHYEPRAKVVTCAHCGHTLALQEANVVDGRARLVGDLRLERRFQGHSWTDLGRVLQCQSCGAELTMTRHLAKICPFCSSPNVLLQDARQEFEKPDGFLPFALDEGDALAAVREAWHSRRGRLQRWWSAEPLEVREMQGLYLPFWVFDGFVEVRTAWMSLFDRLDARAKPLVAKDLLMFENVLFGAVAAPPTEFLVGISPFDIGELVPYEPRLLADWPAVLYSVDVERAVETTQDSMLKAAVRASKPRLRVERSDEPKVHRSYRVTSVTYQLVLLPVWAALAVAQNQVRVALVNGQTGRVAFSRPQKP